MVNNQLPYPIKENINDQYHGLRIGFAACIHRLVDNHEAIVEAILKRYDKEAEKRISTQQKLHRQQLVNLLTSKVFPFILKGVDVAQFHP